MGGGADDRERREEAEADPRGYARRRPSPSGAIASAKTAPKAVGPKAVAKAKTVARPAGSSGDAIVAAAASGGGDDDDVDVAFPKAKGKGSGKIRAPRRKKRELYIPAIGGGEAFYDEYQAPSDLRRRTYFNWHMICPHHDHCDRTRGTGTENTRLGWLQPLAFLHVWKETPPGDAGHRLTDPPAAEVERFLNENHDELANMFSHFATP